MREIFSVRFFAAVGAVVGLFFLLTTVFATQEVIDGGDDAGDGFPLRRVDFVEHVAVVSNPDFSLTVDGFAANDTVLFIDQSRSVQIVADTPGENHCPRFPASGACAIAADLLGEGVVWFALVPAGPNRTVDFPAIDTLDDGIATLVNGWQMPFAPVLDRRCPDAEFESYRELRNVLGDDFTSIYGVDDQRLVAVRCNERVPYAPVFEEDTVELPTVPPPPAPIDDRRATDSLRADLEAAVVGLTLDDASAVLTSAGWQVRLDDLDDTAETFTADLRADRVTVGHQGGVVLRLQIG